MGFYYAAEKKRFERKWDELRKEYESAGMTTETIQLLYEFNWKEFCSQRVYTNHTQAMPSEYIGDDKTEKFKLFQKYVTAATTFDESDFSGRYAWVDAIENQQLALALQKLSDKDLELLTFLVLEEHTQRELAQKWGCSQGAISQRYKKIKKFLK